VVAKIENKNIAALLNASDNNKTQQEKTNTEHVAGTSILDALVGSSQTAPTIFKHDVPEKVIKEYQINTKNLEKFLDVPSTDDNYYAGINKQQQPGCSNGLAYVDEGYGTILKIQFVVKNYSKAHQKKLKDEEEKEGKDIDKDDSAYGEGVVTHTGRLGEVMKESVDVVKIAVFNFLAERP
jgi:ATP-dependent Lon protease